MCEPTTLAIVAIGATVAAAGVSYIGQQQAAAAQKQQADYAAAVAANNQIMANNAAQDAIARGQVAEEQKRVQTQQLIGKQRASLAANGVEVDSGSGLDLTTDTAGLGEQDALTVRSNAAREALGYTQQGMNYEATASLDRMKGDAATSAAEYAGVGTILGAGGSVASQWYGFKYGLRQPGGFSTGIA